MAKKEKKRDKVGKIKESTSDEFQLDDVLTLGGNKADYELLLGIADSKEEMDYEDNMDVDPIKKDEVRHLIKELGFDKIVPKEKSKDTKKVKLLTMPESKEEQEKRIQVIESKTETTKKKKSKNKYKLQVEEVSSTTVDDKSLSTLVPHFVEQYEPRKYLLIKPGGKWFENQWNGPSNSDKASSNVIIKLKAYAEQLMTDEIALFKKKQDSNTRSDMKWRRTVLTSGTLTDKTAALALLIQDSPLHNLQGIESLIGMVKKKGRREALTALDTLKELWLSDLLLEDRKLHTFEDNPLCQVEELASGNKDSRDRRLLVWYFEDQLKQKYENFVKALETWSHDQITTPKKKVMNVLLELLASKPEQEQFLLELIINKLGDPNHKIASHAAQLLAKLVKRHSNMKMVVCSEVERILYRKNIADKAQYYGICFLNQIMLSHAEKTLAAKLIDIYFSFFKLFAKRKSVETKMLSALLTGVNRAFPYAKVDLKSLDEQLATLYKTVHIAQFNTGVQALMLLFQVVDASDTVMCDRYYQALYKKMLDPELRTTSRQEMFLNLLFKSLKKDDSDRRVKAFIKRLLQICCHMAPTFICGALILTSEIIKLKPEVLNITVVNSNLQDDEGSDGNDDGEEHFTDVKGDSDSDISEDNHEEELRKVLSDKGHTTVSSWVHRKNTGKVDNNDDYDPVFRNPMYCHADRECIWELQRLCEHYHPTVVLFAQSLLKGDKLEYTGDPLQDFTLIRFLDRFVYRNPKKTVKNVVSSLQAHSKSVQLKGIKALAVNDEKYTEFNENDVPVEEKFFYKYFKQQADKRKTRSADDADSDAESVSDGEFDNFLDQFENQFDGGDKDVHFDFAGEFDKSKKKGHTTAEDSETDDEDFDDLSDEEVDFGDDFNMDIKEDEEEDDDDFDDEDLDDGEFVGDMAKRGSGTFNEEDIAFSDEDDLDMLDFSKKSKKNKMSAVVKGKKKTNVPGGLFAAAEEFSYLIDENAGSKFDLIGSEAMSNKDNAHVKQLRWESDRDKWVRGQDWKSKKKSQSKPQKKWKPQKRGLPSKGQQKNLKRQKMR